MAESLSSDVVERRMSLISFNLLKNSVSIGYSNWCCQKNCDANAKIRIYLLMTFLLFGYVFKLRNHQKIRNQTFSSYVALWFMETPAQYQICSAMSLALVATEFYHVLRPSSLSQIEVYIAFE